MKSSRFLIPAIIVLIFALGIALRIVELINGNYLLSHDMGRDLLIAKSIIAGKHRLIGNEVGSGVAGINGIFHGPGYLYVVALGLFLFGGDAYGSMVMMAVFGIGSLFLAYYIGKKMYGIGPAVFVLLFTSISYLVVSQSRFIWSSHIATPFIFIALYFTYKIDKNPRIYAPLALFWAALSYHSQLGVAAPMTIAILISLVFVYRIRSVKIYLISFFAILLAILPMLLFEFRHDFLGFRGLFRYLLEGGSHEGIPIARVEDHILFYYYNFINTFTYEFGLFSQTIQKITVIQFLPFALFIPLVFANAAVKKFHISLVIMVLFTWAAYMLLNNVVWDYYLMHNRIIYILFFGYAGGIILQNISKGYIWKLSFLSFIVFLMVFLGGAFYRLYMSYSHDLHDIGGYHKLYGKKFAIDTIYADAMGKEFNVLVFTPYVYTYPYDYLFQTYAKQKYGFVPGTEKKGLTYLLIEPDYGQPWRHKGWLETVVNGGNIIYHKELPTEQILEKREY